MAKTTGLCLKYFVLNPTKDDMYGDASRKAILAYAEAIRETDLDFSGQLQQWEIACRHNIAMRKILSDTEVTAP